MTITLKTEYSMRALIALAENGTEKPLSVAQICKKQKLPLKFIEQLFSKLRKKELITSVRGKYGGYILARPASEITMKDIILAAGDELLDLFCETGNKYCLHDDGCNVNELWIKIALHFNEYFSEITLEHIVKKYR